MYIVGLNNAAGFYFISRAEQRERLEEKGILVLNTVYDRITMAASAIKELNYQLEEGKRKKILDKAV